jgi:hypothetical protein
MFRDLFDADRPRSQQNAIAQAARQLRRWRARPIARPAGRQAPMAVAASFGVIIGLLCIWAVTVNL